MASKTVQASVIGSFITSLAVVAVAFIQRGDAARDATTQASDTLRAPATPAPERAEALISRASIDSVAPAPKRVGGADAALRPLSSRDSVSGSAPEPPNASSVAVLRNFVPPGATVYVVVQGAGRDSARVLSQAKLSLTRGGYMVLEERAAALVPQNPRFASEGDRASSARSLGADFAIIVEPDGKDWLTLRFVDTQTAVVRGYQRIPSSGLRNEP